jgi:hypothetical protein
MQEKKSIFEATHFEFVLFTVDYSEEKGNWTRAELFLSKILINPRPPKILHYR